MRPPQQSLPVLFTAPYEAKSGPEAYLVDDVFMKGRLHVANVRQSICDLCAFDGHVLDWVQLWNPLWISLVQLLQKATILKQE